LVASLSPEPIPASLSRLLGQHPAAVRTVCWRSAALTSTELQHLELESKHGHVVVIDHDSGECHADPPQPPLGLDPTRPRQQRDLSAELPGAFEGRPTFTGFVPIVEAQALRGWRIEFSNGRNFTLTLDEQTPLILPDHS